MTDLMNNMGLWSNNNKIGSIESYLKDPDMIKQLQKFKQKQAL
jgi:hypothetical protein